MDRESEFTIDQLYELTKQKAELLVRRHEATWSAFKAIGVALVGTAAVGITTAVVNRDIRESEIAIQRDQSDRELAISEKSQEQLYLREFVDFALSSDIQVRLDFAQYVSSVTTNEAFKARWAEYHSQLAQELTDTREHLKEKVEELAAALEAKNEEGAESQLQLEALRTEVDRLTQRLASPSNTPKDFPRLYPAVPLNEFSNSQIPSPFVGADTVKRTLFWMGWNNPWSCEELLTRGEAAAVESAGVAGNSERFREMLKSYVQACGLRDWFTANPK